MGGIAGIHHTKKEQTNGEPLVLKMLETLTHRACDSKVGYYKGNTVIGFRYHNSEDEKNVFACDVSKKLWVMMDGEIFDNSLKFKTEASIHHDAVKVLYAYQEKGEKFVDYLDGPFAIAIWDEKVQKLLLVRDRLGAKPLFYAHVQDTILFASEIKAILASGMCERRVNLRALNNFFSYTYLPNPETMFSAIQQVKPGHMLICKDGKIKEKRYWKFKYHIEEQERPENQYIDKFIDIFKRAVSKRLEKHPDAEAFLSGGLDTSGVVSMMYKLRNKPFKVFTAGFKEEAYNEINDAKIVADHFGLDHLTTIVRFDKNFPELLDKIVWHHDAPFADTSAIPSYYAAKFVKEHVETVMTGDFPDQLIGGSGHHVFALNREKHDPAWKRSLRNRQLNRLISSLPLTAGGSTFYDKVKRFLYRETFSLEEQRIIMNMPVPPNLKNCLYSEDLIAVNNSYDPLDIANNLYKEVENESLLNRLLYFDINSYAPDDLMIKVDRMCSAHGLNAISPFHDRELVEFIATIPPHMNIRGENRKYIMREALRPMLPAQTINKKKQGFAMPLSEWLVRNLSDYVRDVLFDSKTFNRGYFNKKFMRTMVENFLAGKTDYASGNETTIISLITLELWHRIFIDK